MKDEGGNGLNRETTSVVSEGGKCAGCQGLGYVFVDNKTVAETCEYCDGLGSGDWYDPNEHPVERTDGSGLWDALDGGGHGHTLGYGSRELVEVWLDGYETGAQENM